MTYLPTTTLTSSPLFPVVTVILVTLAIVLWVISNFSVPLNDQPIEAESLDKKVTVKSRKRIFLRTFSLFSLALTILPILGAFKAHEETKHQAQTNLLINLTEKYEVESLKINALPGVSRFQKTGLDALYEGTQLVSLKKNNEFKIYFLTQDKKTHEPFLYDTNPAISAEPLTKIS